MEMRHAYSEKGPLGLFRMLINQKLPKTNKKNKNMMQPRSHTSLVRAHRRGHLNSSIQHFRQGWNGKQAHPQQEPTSNCVDELSVY